MNDLDEKVRTAMHRIEELYAETDGKCCISFSGGKDSTVLLALTKMCYEIYSIPELIPAVFSNTGIELGVTVDFVNWCRKEWYPRVEIIRPDVSFDWVLKNKGKPILSKLKSEYLGRWQSGSRSRTVIQNMIEGKTNSGKPTWKLKLSDKDVHLLSGEFPIRISDKCCKFLKKKPVEKYVKEKGLNGNMTGVREGEGGARALNIAVRSMNGAKICTVVSKSGFIRKTPIVDWTDEDLESFIQAYNVPLSDAYTKYNFRRTGCMLCPFSRKIVTDLQYLHDHEPNRYKAAKHWLKDVYIAQNVVLPFDQSYERERERMWQEVYEPMRQEMLRKYRPNSRLIKDGEQLSLF